MKIKKDQLVKVSHQKKGVFIAKATIDFDTEERTFYPLILVEGEPAKLSTGGYSVGDEIPCRNSFCSLELV